MMGYVVIAVVAFLLGIKYGELRDIMLARRISKIIAQQNKVQNDFEDYQRWKRQDERVGKVQGFEVEGS